MMRRALTLLLMLALLPGATLAGTAEPKAERPDLVIAHTSDLHAHYRSFENRRGELRGGFSRLAARIAELREEHGERFLYLDAGDLFMGTPFYHLYQGSLGIELLEEMGCDAMALGNHELDDGSVNFLRAAVGGAFPVLCLNLGYPDGTPLLPDAALFDADGLKVELVGVITAAMPELSGECARGELVVRPQGPALREWLADGRPDADLRIVLSHSGLEEDRGIAETVPEIPLILGGHSHSFLDAPETVNGVTICHVGCFGYFLGVVECYRQEDGSWKFVQRRESVTADWPEDPAVRAMIERAAVPIDREMNQVLTELPEAFETRGKSASPNPLGIMIAEAMRRAAGADLGMQNIGGYRTFLPAGPVARERLFELLPFNNRILKLHFSGADLKTLFHALAANHDGGRFAQISGGEYVIQNGMAARVRVGGEVIEPSRTYTLATLDFLYSGGDGYGEVLGLASRADTLEVFGRDLLEARLLNGTPPVPGDYPPNFRVTP